MFCSLRIRIRIQVVEMSRILCILIRNIGYYTDSFTKFVMHPLPRRTVSTADNLILDYIFGFIKKSFHFRLCYRGLYDGHC